MILLHRQLVTDITAITVVAGRSSTYLANPALVAMVDVLLLKFVIEKGAYGTVVRAELD